MPSSGCQTCRSEEHTSELQSHDNLVCRLLLEKKKHNTHRTPRKPPRHTTHSPPPHRTCTRGVSLCPVARVRLLAFVVTCGLFFFFFNDPAPPEISTLSLPAAFPI